MFETTGQLLEKIRSPIGYNPQIITWAFSLDADITSGWKYIEQHIEEYDAVLLEYVGLSDSKGNNLGKMRTELIRKHNPDILMVGMRDTWRPRPSQVDWGIEVERNSRWVELCDMIFTTSNAWEKYDSGREMLWNDIFKTDKFCCLLAPFDIEYLQTLHKTYEEKLELKHIISMSPVNYWATSQHTARVLERFLKDGWRAGLTHVRKREVPSPMYKLGSLPWWDYVDWVSKSYMGVFNAHGGGLASGAGLGAVLKTPFVGSNTADYIVKCFPDLVKNKDDYSGQADLCKRLISEESFWREMSDKGFRICQEQFSFEGAKKRLYDELKNHGLM